MSQDLLKLREKAAEAIRRDLNHIFGEASTGKLSPASARDLVAYYKLLEDLSSLAEEAAAKEKATLSQKSNEELKQLAQSLLNE